MLSIYLPSIPRARTIRKDRLECCPRRSGLSPSRPNSWRQREADLSIFVVCCSYLPFTLEHGLCDLTRTSFLILCVRRAYPDHWRLCLRLLFLKSLLCKLPSCVESWSSIPASASNFNWYNTATRKLLSTSCAD